MPMSAPTRRRGSASTTLPIPTRSEALPRRTGCRAATSTKCGCSTPISIIERRRAAAGEDDVKVRALDHIVLCVGDVARSCRFYEHLLGMEPREERPGKWSLHFGDQKISLQDAAAAP